MHCTGTRELLGEQQRENTSGRIFPRLTMPLVVHFHYPIKVEHFHVINLTGIIKRTGSAKAMLFQPKEKSFPLTKPTIFSATCNDIQ